MIDSDNWTPWTTSGDLTGVPSASDSVPSELRSASGRVDCYTGVGNGALCAANDNYPRLVALTGAAGSGKSTATKFLVERHGYTLVKFAGPLKRMLAALGLDERHIEGDRKELPLALLGGKTPRFAMQTIGTEWGRNCMGENFWVNLWLAHAETAIDEGGRVVVDDCRFSNEAAAVRELGGMIIKLEGRGGIAGQHVSEAGCGQHDALVFNDDGLVELYAEVEEAVRRWAGVTIPEDIQDIANSLDYIRGGPTSDQIASAILAERQRCADMARAVAHDEYGDTSAIGAAATIMRRILS